MDGKGTVVVVLSVVSRRVCCRRVALLLLSSRLIVVGQFVSVVVGSKASANGNESMRQHRTQFAYG
jgi:hypothetical protein